MINNNISAAVLLAFFIGMALSLAHIAKQALSTQNSRNSSVSSVLSETNSAAGFAVAESPREFEFPADHFPHPNFQSEWWYFTGNLVGSNKQTYGFDLTIFRYGLSTDPDTSLSPFQNSQIFLAHFAIADINRQQYLSDEKISREVVGLTGVSVAPLTIKVDNWSITQLDAQKEQWHIKADSGDFAMDLELNALRPIVLQGQQGLSRKSETPGNASYYYSIPKLAVDGKIRLSNQTIPIAGTAWFDREWSTSVLESGQIGWDWFGLHIAEDMELMYYQIRQANGKPASQNHGVLILDNGAREIKLGSEVQLKPLAYWTSKKTRARYPIKWQLTSAEHALDLTISAKFNDQQWDGTFIYWEGAVTTTGVFQNKPINGEGFLEMTGYDTSSR